MNTKARIYEYHWMNLPIAFAIVLMNILCTFRLLVNYDTHSSDLVSLQLLNAHEYSKQDMTLPLIIG